MRYKKCSKCQKKNPLSAFHKNRISKDGLHNQCKECRSKYIKKDYQIRAIYYKQKDKAYYDENKVAILKRHARYRKRTKYHLNYYKEHKEEIIKKKIFEQKNNIQVRLRHILRGRIREALKGKHKIGSAVKDLGCSIEELIIYLESRFKYGMSWNNYGNKRRQWSIDHIKPLSKFDLTDPIQFKEAVYYTNLQPLWHKENLRKHNKFKEYIDENC